MGAALHPREHGPDLTPHPSVPRGRGQHLYNELWPLDGRNAVAVKKFLPRVAVVFTPLAPRVLTEASTLAAQDRP